MITSEGKAFFVNSMSTRSVFSNQAKIQTLAIME